jgi:predicted MFS family arabinose efflux permease
MFYLGVGIGAILSGLLSNSVGRKPSLLLGIFTQIISGLFLSLRVDFGWLCCLRLLYGCGFGSTLAVSATLAT